MVRQRRVTDGDKQHDKSSSICRSRSNNGKRNRPNCIHINRHPLHSHNNKNRESNKDDARYQQEPSKNSRKHRKNSRLHGKDALGEIRKRQKGIRGDGPKGPFLLPKNQVNRSFNLAEQKTTDTRRHKLCKNRDQTGDDPEKPIPHTDQLQSAFDTTLHKRYQNHSAFLPSASAELEHPEYHQTIRGDHTKGENKTR